MEKHVLVVSSSLRNRSNSQTLAEAFAAGAKAAGHQVETITLRGKNLAFCQGCLACQKTGKCVIQDDAPEMVEKMGRAQVIAFATPIYYYEMSGQLKTLLDRANPLYGSDYAFRQIYLLTAAAEDQPFVPQKAISGLQGWIDCFEGVTLMGTVFAGGVSAPGDIEGRPALQAAYDMGKNI